MLWSSVLCPAVNHCEAVLVLLLMCFRVCTIVLCPSAACSRLLLCGPHSFLSVCFLMHDWSRSVYLTPPNLLLLVVAVVVALFDRSQESGFREARYNVLIAQNGGR